MPARPCRRAHGGSARAALACALVSRTQPAPLAAASSPRSVAAARAARVALALATLASCVALPELLLRALGVERPPPPPIVVWNEEKDALLDAQGLLFRRDARTLWALQPDAPLQRRPIGIPGSEERINAAGFRGPLLARERTPGRVRIATLGDSSTFGFGVAWEDTWSARLGSELERTGVASEVLCAGVVGYTVVQGLERYRSAVRPYRPDVVVAAFGACNEGHLDRLSDREKLAASRAGAGALRWLRERSRLVQLVLSLRPASRGEPRPRVTPEELVGELDRLRAEVEADGARLVVLLPPRSAPCEQALPELREYSACLEALVERRALSALDARALLRGWPLGEEDVLLDWFHPNARGHALIAAALAPRVRALAARRRAG